MAAAPAIRKAPPRVRPGTAATDAKPTILDVARRAGVSLGTVSNVLNERGNVSEARQASVAAAIASLRYVPNGLAQSLRRQRSRVVGVCLPVTSNAYFAALLDALEDVAAAHGYEVMQVLSRHDPAIELRRIRALIARQVDGLIVIPSSASGALFDAIAHSGVPAVMVDRASADRRFDYVTTDDRGVAATAAAALLERGHRRLMFLARYPDLVTTRERIRGFRGAVARVPDAHATVLARDPDDSVFAGDFARAMSSPARPTALIASNSDLAVMVMRQLGVLRLHWPRDVSLLSFDAPAWAEVVDPPLTVIRPPTGELARHAFEVLVQRIEGRAGAPRRIVLDATLELRGSVGPPPGPRAAPRPGRTGRGTSR